MLRRLILALLMCTTGLPAVAAHAQALNISLALSDGSAPYRQFADSFSRHLAAGNIEVIMAESLAVGGDHADLIVAVGMKAAELAAAQTGTPVLVAMVPEAGYRELTEQIPPPKNNRKISAIYLDQPWGRRLDFLRAVLPDRRKVGLLYSPDALIDIELLRKNIAARGGSLIARQVRSPDELFEMLKSVLAKSDVLLAIPDSAIYSSSNIRNILLASYRQGVPLIGITRAHVNAGALGAIFSTPEQLAEQAGAAVNSFARTGQMPEPQYPVDFTIAVNPQVPRSLGIDVPLPEAIRRQMNKAKEESP